MSFRTLRSRDPRRRRPALLIAIAPPCPAAAVQGSFAGVPGSAGAGSITYRLRVDNRSATVCFVSGLPRVQLLGAQGRPLPTKVRPARPGTATAAMIQLDPGDTATADARFSPDVP